LPIIAGLDAAKDRGKLHWDDRIVDGGGGWGVLIDSYQILEKRVFFLPHIFDFSVLADWEISGPAGRLHLDWLHLEFV